MSVMKIAFGCMTPPVRSGTLWYQIVGTVQYQSQGVRVAKAQQDGEDKTRERILNAAFALFAKKGFAAASTLEIASQARVSKRELYAIVGTKQEMLIACINARARRLRIPTDLPAATNRETLIRVLQTFGMQLLTEISDPTVV